MMNKKRFTIALASIGMLFFGNCKYDKPLSVADSGYPSAIENIIINKCATAGCHTTKDKSGGFDLSTWNHLFEGTDDGAKIIPYRADQSELLGHINTYADLGNQFLPTMPNGRTPLSHDEVVAIRDWINSGAPDKNGFVKWSDNPDRKKYYVLNQGCNLVTVFDQETRLAMRIISVGDASPNNLPHSVKVSPDNQSWYVDFYGGNMLEKHSAQDEHLVAKIPMPTFGGVGNWSSFAISSDSKKMYLTDWEGTGTVAYINLERMVDEPDTNWVGLFLYPHGCMLNPAGDKLFVAGQQGNFIYEVDVNPAHYPTFPAGPISLNAPTQWNSITPNLDPHEMIFSPDGTKLFITCQDSNEVIVINPSTNALIARIPVGMYPQELSISSTLPYLFVTCMEDTSIANQRGLVSVINYNSYTIEATIYTGWQPHGLAVDDDKNVVYVANQNFSTGGPAPHHTSACGGRNGYITIIDMATLDLIPDYTIEVSTKPYSVTIRH